MAGAELQNATYQQSDTSNQKMKCTILILTFFCPNNMYNMFASEHKCKRYNKRGLIAKMPHSARLQPNSENEMHHDGVCKNLPHLHMPYASFGAVVLIWYAFEKMHLKWIWKKQKEKEKVSGQGKKKK